MNPRVGHRFGVPSSRRTWRRWRTLLPVGSPLRGSDLGRPISGVQQLPRPRPILNSMAATGSLTLTTAGSVTLRAGAGERRGGAGQRRWEQGTERRRLGESSGHGAGRHRHGKMSILALAVVAAVASRPLLSVENFIDLVGVRLAKKI
jgi:hypothetical protein